ncbi:multiple wing hairs isoform X2 [Haematobia irritans]|uniref:multiple wing hairs isoform X2 n=1 Tax=Haematobia irritans TaxID=7368 RepID=UPI003F4FE6F8
MFSEFSSISHSYQMAPSVCQNSPKLPPHNNTQSGVHSGGGGSAGGSNKGVGGAGAAAVGSSSITQRSNCGSSSINGSMASYKMSTTSETSWSQTVFSKENQRPPVYNPEDYVVALKKFGKRQSGANPRSIYDANEVAPPEDNFKSATLPHKHSDYKSPIMGPVSSDSEMSLRQFSTITDLLTKLRADLRVSFPSFVQEFVATPSDGVSLLLEVLRSIQLSQAVNAPITVIGNTGTMPRNSQSYQRRALLDELACLQCLNICCSRSLEATSRLGTTPVGLMPLASSATGQGIRARILAMQLMANACDKNSFGHGNQKFANAGHTAISEAMSTLRLRCSEPVRFRLLMGMLNSGGGSGELQAVGVKFINAFLESSENLQQRLYLQAELFQAGFDPNNLAKTISSSSPWLDVLRQELKKFHDIYVDVDKMITQSREADRVRSQMVILERRVQILHEEKAVLTSMERRLQERCAELQREIFRLQGAQNENTFKSLDKQPVTLPRHIPPGKQQPPDSSEHEDEGISSSDTGPSLSPVPILVLPQHNGKKMPENTKLQTDPAIEDAMEELDNVVNEAEKQLSHSGCKFSKLSKEAKEKEIVPVNIVPQPPRKSRSLAHLVQPDGSDIDGSEYGMLLMQKTVNANQEVAALKTFFDESDYVIQDQDKSYHRSILDSPEIPESAGTKHLSNNTTRELLDVIMNARHCEDDPTMKALREGSHCPEEEPDPNAINMNGAPKRESFTETNGVPPQQFNGVFFMTGMNTAQKYPKPDLTAALQARRVTKNVERLEAVFASHNEAYHEADQQNGKRTSLMPSNREKSKSNQQIYFGSNPTIRIGPYNPTHNSRPDLLNNNHNVTTRTRSYTQGSKVTDIPSGLY